MLEDSAAQTLMFSLECVLQPPCSLTPPVGLTLTNPEPLLAGAARGACISPYPHLCVCVCVCVCVYTHTHTHMKYLMAEGDDNAASLAGVDCVLDIIGY